MTTQTKILQLLEKHPEGLLFKTLRENYRDEFKEPITRQKLYLGLSDLMNKDQVFEYTGNLRNKIYSLSNPIYYLRLKYLIWNEDHSEVKGFDLEGFMKELIKSKYVPYLNSIIKIETEFTKEVKLNVV